jgi:predicted O-methyltransferase YrrM
MVDITRAQRIEGWMEDPDLLWLAEQASTHSKIVEVGSWFGRSTRAIVDNTTGVVVAVDTWEGSDEDAHRAILAGKPENWLFGEFAKNMEGLPTGRLYAFRGLSVDATKYYRHMGVTFDMVFLDAAHDYENVAADIRAWQPLIAPRGIISGHDYGSWDGVTQAVDELLPDHKVGGQFIWYKEL